SLEGVTEINFIAHSLGNLVVRHWLKDLADEGRRLPDGQSFGRMVMLTPPNLQPRLATILVRGKLAQFVAGPAAEAMASGWEGLEPRLATPPFEFGVLAGGKGDGRGYNPLIPGDDDGVVTVASTRLAGARDFRLLPVLHTFFMNDRRVQEYAVRFLRHGYFESEETRQPIEED
ncbi:MAG TPA: lipase, partial [Lacipirellulaceae bacterium]|nr:lipase [Lacipirellulaceae bacterium]